MPAHDDVIAVRGDVQVRVLHDAEGADAALALLDAAESVAEVPLVDESERARLEALAAGEIARASHWGSLLALRGEVAVGYAGTILPDGGGDGAECDLAVRPDAPPRAPTLSALLAGLEGLARRHDAADLQVWLRHAAAPDVARASERGYRVERRLGVLGRELDPPPPWPAVPDGVVVRAFRPAEDAAAVAAVLSAAYEGTPEGDWDVDELERRQAYDWFRPEDLLVVVDTDGIAGVHWTKRRGGGVGEVYNLAVAPRAQGRGLGALLLRAGLAHLAEVGCRDVLLWVDLANERAVRLYRSHGFHTRWEDVALTRTLRG